MTMTFRTLSSSRPVGTEVDPTALTAEPFLLTFRPVRDGLHGAQRRSTAQDSNRLGTAARLPPCSGHGRFRCRLGCRSSGRVSGVAAQEVPPRPAAGSSSRWRAAARVLLVAAGFVAIAELGALVLSEYVGTSVFSWLLPGLLGAGSGELASTVSYPVRRVRPVPAVRLVIWVAGIVAPVVATVQAFRLADVPYGPAGRWLPPVSAAVAGALLMLLLPAPGGRAARRSRAAGQGHESEEGPAASVRSERRSPTRRPGSRRSAGPDGSTK